MGFVGFFYRTGIVLQVKVRVDQTYRELLWREVEKPSGEGWKSVHELNGLWF